MKRIKNTLAARLRSPMAAALAITLILTSAPATAAAAESSDQATSSQVIQELEELKTAVLNAENDLISAQETVQKAQTAYDEAAQTMNTENAAISSAEATEKDAKDLYDEALKDQEEASDKLVDIQKALTEASDALAAAQTALSNAEDAKTDAGVQIPTAEDNLSKAQAALSEALNAQTEAQARVDAETPDPGTNEGHKEWTAYGFFQYVRDSAEAGSARYWDAQCALDILDGGVNTTGHSYQTGQGPAPDGYRKANWGDIASNITWASRGDAVALDNVRTSLQFLKEFNSIRAEENEAEGTSLRTDIGTNCRQMAVSIVQCDASKDYTVGHTMAYDGLEDLSWSSLRAVPFSRREYTDPYVGWYDEEKINYKEQNGGVTGHYTTIVDLNSGYFCEIAGFAVCQEGASFGECRELSTYGDFFDYDIVPTPEAQYSVADLTELFDAYYTAQVEAGMLGTSEEVHEANAQALENASANAAAAQSDVEAAQQALDSAKADLSASERELEEAGNALESAREAVARCQTESADAQEALNKAEANVSQTREAWEAAAEELNSLQKGESYLQAAGALAAAEEDLKAAKADVSTAQDALTQAKDTLKAFTSLSENENITIIANANGLSYTGKPIKLAGNDLKVVYRPADGEEVVLISGVDYSVSYKNNTNAGTATILIDGLGDWSGTKTASFTIAKAASSIKLAAQSKAYTGKALKYSGKVTRTGSTGNITYAYYSDAKCTKTVKTANVKKPRTYYVKATLKADKNCKGAKSNIVKFTITKGKNPLTVTAAKKTIKYSALKKANKSTSPLTVSKAQGTVSYAVSKWTTKNAEDYFTVNAKSGKVTAKKGTPKGTYKFKVKVTANGKGYYKAGSKTVTVQIVVK